jgi:hypothetical protein
MPRIIEATADHLNGACWGRLGAVVASRAVGLGGQMSRGWLALQGWRPSVGPSRRDRSRRLVEAWETALPAGHASGYSPGGDCTEPVSVCRAVVDRSGCMAFGRRVENYPLS